MDFWCEVQSRTSDFEIWKVRLSASIFFRLVCEALTLRVTGKCSIKRILFEYFKIEPSTDFDSPSQCQHQHHHSYFVNTSSIPGVFVSIVPVMLIRCQRMGTESFFLVQKLKKKVRQNHHLLAFIVLLSVTILYYRMLINSRRFLLLFSSGNADAQA